MADSDVVMDTVDDDDVEMTATEAEDNVEIEANSDTNINKNNDNTAQHQNQNSDPQNTNNCESTDTQEQTANNDNTEGQQSLLIEMNELISSIPRTIEDCNKSHFFLILLLITEVQNTNTKEKIDYLLLFHFLNNLSEWKSFESHRFGANVLKSLQDIFLKSFIEKTDFDIHKLTEIQKLLTNNNCTECIDRFKQNISQIDLTQTMRKYAKCVADLSTDTKDGWKQFKVGMVIDCCDQWGKWYRSKIMKHKTTTDDIEKKDELNEKQKERYHELQGFEAIYVNYIDWDHKYDEWIFIDPEMDIFCECKDKCDREEESNKHRIAVAQTQSVYKNRGKNKKKKKEEAEIEEIKYKITDFEELKEYIDNTYEAPPGRNRTGMGAVQYANATLHGPGGNLTKFKYWDKQKSYDRFHHSHYDWWIFPNDRDSWGQGRRYALFQDDIDALLEVDGYVENYTLATRLVLRSWGWNMDNKCFIQNGNRDQRWTGYNVRLLKMLYSTIILKQWDIYHSVYAFCIALLEKGHQFRSEPMMYDYLGLHKPKSVRRYRW